MKHSLIMFMAAVCLVLATSCQKEPHFHPAKYRIDKIWGNLYPAKWDTLRFYYDKYGNPDSIIRNYDDFRHAQTRFLYSPQKRLIGIVNYMRNPYNPQPGVRTYESWRTFKYDALNRIVADTFHSSGVWGSGDQPQPLSGRENPWVIYQFNYDVQNRIIKQTELWYSGDTAAVAYTYNTAGNLVSEHRYPVNEPDYVLNYTHDNLKSFTGLHPIWQLLTRDFSVNNKYTPGTGNNWGLPATFSQSDTHQEWQWLFSYTNAFSGTANISYKKN